MIMSKAIKATGAAMASIALTLSMAPMAFAADGSFVDTGNTFDLPDGSVLHETSTNTAHTKLTVEVENPLYNVTVPTEVSMIVDNDGNVITPANIPIVNESKITTPHLGAIEVIDEGIPSGYGNLISFVDNDTKKKYYGTQGADLQKIIVDQNIRPESTLNLGVNIPASDMKYLFGHNAYKHEFDIKFVFSHGLDNTEEVTD